jgi:hypothetical protein
VGYNFLVSVILLSENNENKYRKFIMQTKISIKYVLFYVKVVLFIYSVPTHITAHVVFKAFSVANPCIKRLKCQSVPIFSDFFLRSL